MASPSPSPTSLPQATPAAADTAPHHADDRGRALSPNATPFSPSFTGRSKNMRWDEICISDCSDDEDEGDEPEGPYLRAACRAISTTPTMKPGLEAGGSSAAGSAGGAFEATVGVPDPKRRRQRQRRRKRGAGVAGGARYGLRQAAPAAAERVPVHQRLDPHRRATAPDRDGWQHVLPQRPEQAERATRQPPRRSRPVGGERGRSPRGHRAEVDGRCLNGRLRRYVPGSDALLQVPRPQPLRAGLQEAADRHGHGERERRR